MNKEFLYKVGYFIFGAGFVALGIVILTQGSVVMQYAAIIGGCATIFHGIHNMVVYFTADKITKRKLKGTWILNGLAVIAIGAIILIFPNFTMGTFIILMILYVFINAAVKLIDYIHFKRNNISGRFYDLLSFIFFTVFGILAIFIPDWGSTALIVVSGIYFILYGVSQLKDFVALVLPQKAKNSLKRHIRIITPVFIASFLPISVLRKFNSFMETSDPDISKNPLVLDEYREVSVDDPPDIEVMVHVADDGVGKMGHCDMCFEGQVLCYGNYDAKSQYLFTAAGDGVFLICDPKPYIRFSVTHDKQMIFSYGIRLSELQRQRIKEEIEKLKGRMVQWKSAFEEAKEKNKAASIDDYKDYGSLLWNGTGGSYYKLTGGRFKTFFVPSTNCVGFIDHILGKVGSDIIKLDGIISPGSYFDYMEREYDIEGSMVISRTIYTEENTSSWKTNDNM